MQEPEHRIYSVSVASVYPHYVAKAEKKIVQNQKLMKLYVGLLGIAKKNSKQNLYVIQALNHSFKKRLK